jgi:hypothetical protein|tara:strand:+ start:9904 stop:10221 length:318 start_codon:yes stop_codon:yes gene_type:complete
MHDYAVISNHYHLVLRLNAAEIKTCSDADLVDWWLSLCPARNEKNAIKKKDDVHRAMLSCNPQRLGSISWLMRFINEPLTRMANIENRCAGRFGKAASSHSVFWM